MRSIINKRIEKGLEPEVSITMTAADILATLTFCEGEWTMFVEDTGFDDMRRRDLAYATQRESTLVLDTLQASAIMALFVGYAEDKDQNALVSLHLYAIANEALKDVPKNLRIIP